MRSKHGLCHFSSLLESLLQVSSHVERTLWVLVSLSLEEGSESFDGVWELDQLAWLSREDFTHEEWLGEESLNLSGSGDSDLVFFGQLVHTQNSDNILERLVVLEQLLHSSGGVVMQVSYNGRVEHSAGGVEGVDGGVDSQLGQGSVQHGGGVQMGKGGRGCGVSQIIGGHVDGLHGGNGSLLGGGNSLLEGSEIGSQGGLISDGGWDTSEQGGHFRAGLGESEDVVNEKEHVLVLLVSEVLSNGQTGKADSGSGSGGLVHLTVHKGGLRAGSVNVDNSGVDHLVVEIVSLSGSLSDSSED